MILLIQTINRAFRRGMFISCDCPCPIAEPLAGANNKRNDTSTRELPTENLRFSCQHARGRANRKRQKTPRGQYNKQCGTHPVADEVGGVHQRCGAIQSIPIYNLRTPYCELPASAREVRTNVREINTKTCTRAKTL